MGEMALLSGAPKMPLAILTVIEPKCNQAITDGTVKGFHDNSMSQSS